MGVVSKITRAVSIRLLVLLFVFLFLEGFVRAVATVKSCQIGECSLDYLTRLTVWGYANDLNVGLTTTHPELGHIPAAGFDRNIEYFGWDDVRVTINDEGFRANDNDRSYPKTVLAVGDSFTFGDQVNNIDTWPSCLERRLETGVINAGVFGYGAAQALKRATLIIEGSEFDTVIFSIWASDNFKRDRFDFRSGFPRSAVVNVNGVTGWAPVPSADARGSKSNPIESSVLTHGLRVLRTHSLVVDAIFQRLTEWHLIDVDLSGMRLTRMHPNSASQREIIVFTIERFAKFDVENKVILLQYSEEEIANGNFDARDFVLEEAKKYDLVVIDTYDHLKYAMENSSEDLWNGHHTKAGNRLVCDLIAVRLEGLRAR